VTFKNFNNSLNSLD